jgi:Tfp pilus assembly protein PilP
MKKILLLITALALIGCGSIIKDKTNFESDTKSDFKASKIDFKRFTDSSYILKPFDASKPMLIGKDTLVNVIIENHYRDRVHIVKDTIHKLDTQVIELSQKNKETDNTKLFLWIAGVIGFFLFLVVLVILWYINKKLTI